MEDFENTIHGDTENTNETVNEAEETAAETVNQPAETDNTESAADETAHETVSEESAQSEKAESEESQPKLDIDDTPVAPVTPVTPVTEKKEKKDNNTLKVVIAAALIVVSGLIGGFVGATVVANKLTASDGAEITSGTLNQTVTTTYNDMSRARAKASASVVTVTVEEDVTANNWFQNYSYTQTGSGSGVIISDDGYIITCNHVVEDASRVYVTIGENQYDATVVGADSVTDVAVIKIDTDDELTPATIGDSDSLTRGNGVMTIGNPLGLLSNSVASGIVSAINRDVTISNTTMTLIQTDAAVSPGNSGGGLFDLSGNLVGIVNAKYADEDVEGIGFAIPINKAMEIAKELMNSGYVSTRATLGVTIVSQNNAIYVYSVVEGSRADEAGIEAGDEIVAVDNNKLSATSDLQSYIAKCEVGQEVKLIIVRDSHMYEVTATLKSARETNTDNA